MEVSYIIHFNRIFPYKPSSSWGTPNDLRYYRSGTDAQLSVQYEAGGTLLALLVAAGGSIGDLGISINGGIQNW